MLGSRPTSLISSSSDAHVFHCPPFAKQDIVATYAHTSGPSIPLSSDSPKPHRGGVAFAQALIAAVTQLAAGTSPAPCIISSTDNASTHLPPVASPAMHPSYMRMETFVAGSEVTSSSSRTIAPHRLLFVWLPTTRRNAFTATRGDFTRPSPPPSPPP